jgi:hypothetical protein
MDLSGFSISGSTSYPYSSSSSSSSSSSNNNTLTKITTGFVDFPLDWSVSEFSVKHTVTATITILVKYNLVAIAAVRN